MKKLIKKVAGSNFIQGGLLFTIANFATGFLNYLFNSLSAKALGPSGYGEISTLFAYLTIASVPIAVITTDVIRRLGQKGEKRLYAFAMWEKWIRVKIYKWLWLVIPYSVLMFFLPHILNISFISSLTFLVLLPTSFFGAYYLAAFQGIRLFLYAALLITIPIFLKLAGAALAYINLGDLQTIMVFIMLSGITTVFYAKRLTKKAIANITPSVGKKLPKSITQVIFTKNIVITLFSLVSVSFLNNFDIVFVKKFLSATETGIYGAWSLFAKIIFYVFGSVISLSLIFFSSREHAKYHKVALLTILSILLAGAAVAYLLYSLFGYHLILLLFSDKYQVITPYLPLAALFGFLYTLIFILNNFFLAKNSKFSLTAAIGALCYVGLLLLFGKNLKAIFQINVYFSAVLAGLYILLIIYYNMREWKPQKANIS